MVKFTTTVSNMPVECNILVYVVYSQHVKQLLEQVDLFVKCKHVCVCWR